MLQSTKLVHAGLAEPYKKSLAKAVKKSLEERRYRIVVMDAPNAQIKDFQDIWTAAQVVLSVMNGQVARSASQFCFS